MHSPNYPSSGVELGGGGGGGGHCLPHFLDMFGPSLVPSPIGPGGYCVRMRESMG